MKSFFPITVIALLLVSCTKEIESPSPENGVDSLPNQDEYVELTIVQKNGKTILDDDAVVTWEAGDKIIVNGEEYSISSGGTTATVSVKKADHYSAFFPAQIYNSGNPLIQPAQYYVKDSFGSVAFPMRAESSTTTLEFTSLFGVLELTVKGSETVASINVKDNGSGSVCGKYEFSGTKLVPAEDVQYDNVTLNCMNAGGVKLLSSGKKFNIVLPARTYNSGITITISSTSGHAMVLNSSTPRTIVAGHVLCPPEIVFSYDSDQIYSYHFDNFTYGADPVAGKKGFAVTNPSAPGPYEICEAMTSSATTAGTGYISTDIEHNGSSYFALGTDYVSSRSLGRFTMLGNTVECHGYLGAGINGGNPPNIKLPSFSNLPSGTICKAEVCFKLAWQEGHSSSPLSITHTYSTTGKILELWIDGVKKADYTPNGTASGSLGDNSRWSTSQSGDEVQAKYYNTEWVRVLLGDLPSYTWHEVKLVLGAVTPGTVIQISPKIADGISSAFFIDDIEAKRIDYTVPETYLPWTLICNPMSATTLNYIKNHGNALKMGGENHYIDIMFPDYNTLKNTWGWNSTTVLEHIEALAADIETAGYKVWNIHMPDCDEDGSYETNVFEFFHPTSSVRNAAVNRMQQIIRWAKPLKAINLTIHATGPGRYSYSYNSYKSYGVASFNSLVSYANSSDMEYPDGSHPIINIENIQNNGTNTTHVCARPEYMNYYCSQVPGLKVCFDAGHSIVGSNLTAVQYLSTLGGNVGTVHIHGNGTTSKDYHLYPGYSNGVFSGSGSYPCGNDLINWPALYEALTTDCGYSGPFSYELGVEAVDGIVSFNNVAHNYYSFILNNL
ncbi:MAG: hypothetical protein IJR01_05685 [Bacteroidales bacterium]|nr:hypothetical protein [Bacteroidales bacterium]